MNFSAKRAGGSPTIFISSDKILFFKAENKTVILMTDDGEEYFLNPFDKKTPSLTQLDALLNFNRQFANCHKSYRVNKDHISHRIRNPEYDNQWVLVLKGGVTVPVGRRKNKLSRRLVLAAEQGVTDEV